MELCYLMLEETGVRGRGGGVPRTAITILSSLTSRTGMIARLENTERGKMRVYREIIGFWGDKDI